MLPENDVRETPPELFAARAEKVGGFTLDAAATPANAKCDRFYTEKGYWVWHQGAAIRSAVCFDQTVNGLTGPWFGRVWINPPFSDISAWVAKCWRECARSADQSERIRTGYGPHRGHPEPNPVELIEMLVPSTRTEQEWWQKLVEPYRDHRPSPVAGYRLTTENLEGRQHFLENGKPIMRKNKDGSLWINPKTGKPQRSSPKFGCVILHWEREKNA